jgi:hypothetical protein
MDMTNTAEGALGHTAILLHSHQLGMPVKPELAPCWRVEMDKHCPIGKEMTCHYHFCHMLWSHKQGWKWKTLDNSKHSVPISRMGNGMVKNNVQKAGEIHIYA